MKYYVILSNYLSVDGWRKWHIHRLYIHVRWITASLNKSLLLTLDQSIMWSETIHFLLLCATMQCILLFCSSIRCKIERTMLTEHLYSALFSTGLNMYILNKITFGVLSWCVFIPAILCASKSRIILLNKIYISAFVHQKWNQPSTHGINNNVQEDRDRN